MNTTRLILSTLAAASLTACAQTGFVDDAATRAQSSPLTPVGPTLSRSDVDQAAPLMSIAEITRDSADRRTGELTEFSDTLWQFPEPEDVPQQASVSARSTISLL